MSVVPPGTSPFYYRTADGAEIDLILEFSANEKWIIEIKSNSVPTLSKGFHIACADVKPEKRFVVYSGKDRFILLEDVVAISLMI